jgi:hypothetical protein
MRNITEPGCPSGDGGVFAAVRFSTRSSGKTETMASNFSWLEVRELRQKGGEDDQPEDRRNSEIPADRRSF